ncbi:MAG: ankyrin repeat domain-containing protein [Clostridia bacterium]|nr:ankyrin repeat domain-containing protein [Clostridia bacterium]
MTQEFINEMGSCLWRHTLEEAPAIIERHINEIDFDDDDDVEKIIGYILDAIRTEEDTSLLEIFVSKGLDINYKLLGKECLILKIADCTYYKAAFEKAVELGADVYSENNKGDNVLLIAANREFMTWNKDNQEELAVHIADNYDLSRLDKADKYGLTPLMYAVISKKHQLADALIAKGSDVNGTGTSPLGGFYYWMDMNGVSPLALAIRHGNTEMVKKLLDAGADEELRDAKGLPPVFSLIQFPSNFQREFSYVHPIYKHKSEITGLLKNLDLTNEKNYTVLMQSLSSQTQCYTREITKVLIENGANVTIVGNDGKSALLLAAEYSDVDIIKALVKAGADVNAQDNDGNTALILSCKRSDEKAARYLIRASADFNIKNNKGESPADLAAANGLNDVLELMI